MASVFIFLRHVTSRGHARRTKTHSENTMKIKTLAAIAAALTMTSTPAGSQAEAIENSCAACFKSPYIITGRPFKSLLTGDEAAEFRATLFSGTTYRIAVGNGEHGNIVFSLYDTDHNLLFASKDHGNAPYWDFSVDGYMDCIVEARLDATKAASGIAIVMTGFKLNEDAQ